MFLAVHSVRAATELAATAPDGVAPDNATVAAVLCTITGGYPSNIYAIKGTFSADGRRPFYGVTWAASRQMWAGQEERWDTCQAKVTTDQYGNFTGYIFMRLEQTAPLGLLVFRISAEALSPIEDPGPSVGDWSEVRSLKMAPGGNGAWLKGHVYTDPQCKLPANGIVVTAIGTSGSVAGACPAQYTAMDDGGDPTDTGFFRMAVPSGWVNALQGRSRANKPVQVYVKVAAPWFNAPGETASVDNRPFGDVNGDGTVDAHDVYLALRMAAGLQYGISVYAHRADTWPAGGDGTVSLGDAVRIARIVYGR